MLHYSRPWGIQRIFIYSGVWLVNWAEQGGSKALISCGPSNNLSGVGWATSLQEAAPFTQPPVLGIKQLQVTVRRTLCSGLGTLRTKLPGVCTGSWLMLCSGPLTASGQWHKPPCLRYHFSLYPSHGCKSEPLKPVFAAVLRACRGLSRALAKVTLWNL